MKSLKESIKKRLSNRQRRYIIDLFEALKAAINPILVASARRARIGKGTFIDRTTQVLGWRNVRFGQNCVISEFCCFNINNRGDGRLRLSVGDNTFIGRRNFFSSGDIIVLGQYVLTGVDCRFLGSGHVQNPLSPYIATGTTSDGRIELGTNCWLGVGVTILGNVTIGHGSIVGAGSLVTRSAPPFSMLVGSPARVVKRYDILSQSWISADLFTEEHARSLPDEDSYLALLQSSAPHIRMPRVAAGKSQGDLS